jgi:hypothetical protein
VRRIAPLLLGLGLLVGCAPSEEESSFLSRKALLERQNQGIRELIAEAGRGSLVPSDRFLIGIDEAIVGDIFRSQLPLERPLGKHFRLHLDSAAVALRDKFGAITIEGYVYRPRRPDRRTAVRVFGGLGAVGIDPGGDRLNVDIAIDHIEILEAGILENILGGSGKKLLAQKGRALVQDAIPRLEVPVVLGRSIRVPAIEESGFRLDSLVVPLDLSVERVIAVGGKLWVTLDATVGKVTGAEQGLGVSVRKKPKAAGAR